MGSRGPSRRGVRASSHARRSRQPPRPRGDCATVCYMSESDRPARVGVRELRQNLSVYLDRVKAGETLEVTEHGHPVARLGPNPPARMSIVDRLIAEGKITPATTDHRTPASAAEDPWPAAERDPAGDAGRGRSMTTVCLRGRIGPGEARRRRGGVAARCCRWFVEVGPGGDQPGRGGRDHAGVVAPRSRSGSPRAASSATSRSIELGRRHRDRRRRAAASRCSGRWTRSTWPRRWRSCRSWTRS